MQKVFNKREKTTLYLTVGVIISAVFFNFVIIPLLNKNDLLSKEINVSRAKLQKYLWLLSQKDYIENKYSKFSSLGNNKSSKDNSLVGVLSELEDMAKNSGIKIIDIRPGANMENNSKTISADLRAEGKMEGYLKFMYNIENSFSVLRIKEFQISSRPNNPLLEGNFTIQKLAGSD